MERIDWCKFFADIERDPKAITPRITVRQLLEAREHVSVCGACGDLVGRVLAKAPKEGFPRQGEN